MISQKEGLSIENLGENLVLVFSPESRRTFVLNFSAQIFFRGCCGVEPEEAIQKYSDEFSHLKNAEALAADAKSLLLQLKEAGLVVEVLKNE